MRIGKTGSLLLAGVMLAACDAADPTSFERLRDDAEVVVVSSAGGGNGATGFGAVLLGFGTRLPDTITGTRLLRASRFAASAGTSGPYSVFTAFDEQIVDARTTSGLLPTPSTGARYTGCVAGLFCGEGSSVSFAATEIWHQDAAITRHGCVIVPSGSAIVDSRLGTHHEQVHVRCEETPTQIQPIDVPVEHVELGISATSLPPEHPLGAAIFGAPGDGADGRLYRFDDYPVLGFIPVDLPGTPSGAAIGRTLASVTLADGTLLLATGGQGRPNDPVVVVATIDPAGGAQLRACLRGRGTRFGSALAFGDFDADGTPDLAVGAGAWTAELAATQHVDQPVALYAGSALVSGRALGCEDPPTTPLMPARSVDCPSDSAAGFVCAATTNDPYAGFGASLAAADVNGDGHDDLVVGAPLSGIRIAGGGAVVVLAGGTSFAALGQDDHAFLTYPSLMSGAHLGAALSTLPGVDRAEIVAGVPGQGHVALIFCSGIRGDRPEDFANVPGVTHGCVRGPVAQADVDASIVPVDVGVPDDAGMDGGGADAGDDAGADAGDLDADVDAGVDADVDADVDAG